MYMVKKTLTNVLKNVVCYKNVTIIANKWRLNCQLVCNNLLSTFVKHGNVV